MSAEIAQRRSGTTIPGSGATAGVRVGAREALPVGGALALAPAARLGVVLPLALARALRESEGLPLAQTLALPASREAEALGVELALGRGEAE